MIVRNYKDSDEGTFRKIHAKLGADYKFPDLNSPLFIVKTVVERAGSPTTLVAARLSPEAYLLTDGAPQEKWEDIQTAQEVFLGELWKQGLDDVYCAVPNFINRSFSRRMKILGWTPARKDWTVYTRRL